MLASELRQEAVSRLATIAGYDERLDVAGTLARPRAVQVLIRQALKASAADELLFSEVRQLAPIAGGRAWVLDDATHDTGLPQATPSARMSLEDLSRIVSEELA